MPDPGRGQRVTPGAVFAGLATLIVAGLAARDAAVQVTAFQYPELAVRLAPANATAITRVFDKTVLSPEGLRQNLSQWILAAKQALRSDPLNANGIRLLAYVTELTPGDTSRARDLMLLSERASRRDLLAQMWLIEDAVQRGDVAGVLKHYDRALSVRPALAGQFFPILASAVSETPVQEALIPYLRANRPWVPSFLSVIVSKSPDPVGVAALFKRYGGSRAVATHGVFETTLLGRLALMGNLREAEAFAAQAGAGAAMREFGFAPATIERRFRPLTWTLYDGPDGEVGLVGSGALNILVRPEARVVAASRIIPTPPGTVILRLRITYPDRDATPLITWRVYCRHLDRAPQQIWVRDLPADAAGATVETQINAPVECAGLQVDVEATGASGSSDYKAMIDRVALDAR